MKTQLQTVNFHNQTLLTIEQNNIHYVAMKPICENIGLAWNAQLLRIKRDEVLSQGMIVMITPTNGGEQEMVCLPIQYLNGWLFGIDVKRVKPEIRETLITYKRECYQALFDYWNKGKAERKQTTVDDRTGLRDAVNVLVAKRKLTHSEVYGFIHQRFNVEKIEQLTAEQILQAIEYVQKLTIGVEIVLPEPANKIALNLDDFYVLAKAVNYLNHSIPEWERLEDLFSDLESHKNYKTAFNLGTASNNLAQTAERIVMRHTSLLQEGSIRNEIENWIFNSPRTEQRPTKAVSYLR
ncbi:phage antirepressor N-terminal domain-containing protein [Avibacterium sp. 21-594]|uniref:phage antirepressor N-terminal domain-containing protein n=1 Tax=Avibacterium sp. 21-594 TaxID=2911535 RepID=UPI0022451F6D|nr:phage antirepressor N-terminal domain-containing protein [Avibacterium sp. 21-594]MCW9716747.1 phage antirepressor N-terminal domain-containing protein [Avibacterium sp. 21-594]